MLKTPDALRFAQERDLDLVEVAPEARPPVCRVLDYSKYKYEQAQKLKQARKHQQQITVREIKFRPKIAQHDYDTKKHHVERFLRHRDKVKVTIMFRGREVTHPERGTAILDRLAEELAELGVVEQRPMQEGRNMTMMLGPSKAVLAGRFDVSPDGAGPPRRLPLAGERAEADGAAEVAERGRPGSSAGCPRAGRDVSWRMRPRSSGRLRCAARSPRRSTPPEDAAPPPPSRRRSRADASTACGDGVDWRRLRAVAHAAARCPSSRTSRRRRGAAAARRWSRRAGRRSRRGWRRLSLRRPRCGAAPRG